MSAATEEPDRDGGVEGAHLHSVSDHSYRSGTPQTGQWRDQETDEMRRNAQQRAEQALDEKLIADRKAQDLAERAQEARVGLEGNQIALDPRRKRRIWLEWALAAAITVAAIDALPAYWAAEALGHGMLSTATVAAILVAALTGFAALITHFKREGSRRMFWCAAALAVAMIGVQTGLRLEFLIITSNTTWLGAALEAGLLAAITLSLVWVGYIILDHAEPVGIWRQRREVKRLQKEAKNAQAAAIESSTSYVAAKQASEHVERSRVGQRERLEADIPGKTERARTPADDLFDSAVDAAGTEPKSEEDASGSEGSSDGEGEREDAA
jgi:hypothetical protein